MLLSITVKSKHQHQYNAAAADLEFSHVSHFDFKYIS